jgi:hypothetical protein
MNAEVGYLYTLIATLATLLSAGALIVGSAWLWALKSLKEAAPLIASTALYIALFFGSPPPAIQAAFTLKPYTLWDAARLLVFGVALMLLAHAAYLAWRELDAVEKRNRELEREVRTLKAQETDRPRSSGGFGGGHHV